MQNLFLFISLFFISSINLLQANSKPTAIRVYSEENVAAVPQVQSLASVGTLNSGFGTSGSLSVATQLSGSQARVIKVLPDGTFLVALSKSSVDSVVAKFTDIGTIEATYSAGVGFGTSGVADLGTGTAVAQTMIIDAQNRSLIAGGDDTTSGTAGWLKRVSTSGVTVTSFSTGTSWQFIGGLAQQTTGEIIAAGSNNSHAQIARYNLSGTLDTTFASSGMFVFDGSSGRPTATSGLYSVVVDANNLIYVIYLDGSSNAWILRLTAAGALDTTFNSGSSHVAITALNSATPAQMRLAIDVNGNLIAAGQVSGNVVVTGVTSSAGSISSFSNYTTSGGSTYDIHNLLTMTDNTIIFIGSNESAIKNRITRLTNLGALDTTFNPSGTPGYIEFSVSSPSTTSLLLAMSSAPNGLLYAAGYQVNSGTTTPYVYNLFNSPYVTKVAQHPASQEQGNRDLSFGSTSIYSGIVVPFNGLYAQSLQQKARAVTELASGNLLVGSDGLTNSSVTPTMMLTRLTSSGSFDTTFGPSSNGLVTLQNTTSSTETLLAVLENPNDTTLFVAGSCATGAILRKYTSTGGTSGNGVETWAVLENTLSSYQGTGLALQYYQTVSGTAKNRILLFVNEDGTHGHISGYTLTGSGGSGVLDTGFGASGSGQILTTSYTGLNMGPLYGGVNPEGNIFVAYKNSATGFVDVAAFKPDGSGLQTQFAQASLHPGIYHNVFGLGASISATNVRIGLDNNHNIIVATVNSAGTGLQVARLDSETGDLDPNFNSTGKMTIASVGVSLALNKITGLSDGSILLTVTDDTATTVTDNAMMVLKITPAGVLDVTFDSQGTTPGILSVQLGNRTSSYYARAATGLTVQSATGNLIVSGYEQQLTSDAMPMLMRVYGASGTTEVKNYPTQSRSAGTIDTSFTSFAFASTLVAEFLDGYPYSLSSPFASFGYIIDANCFGTTAYNFGGSGFSGIAIDASNNILLAGWNISTNGAYIPRYLPTGLLDTVANGGSGFNTTGYINDFAFGLARAVAVYPASDPNSNAGKIIAVGQNSSGSNGYIKRYLSTGAVDTSFGTSGAITDAHSVTLRDVAIDANGNIVVVGDAATANYVYLARYGATGSLDTSGFNASGTPGYIIDTNGLQARSLAIDSSGRIIVVAYDGSTNGYMARYLSTGVFDTTSNGGSGFNQSGTPGYVFDSHGRQLVSVAIDSSGRIVVTGLNSSNGGYVARYLANGLRDTVANSGTGFNQSGTPGYVFDSNFAYILNQAFDASGNIVVGGYYTTGGVFTSRIARYLSSGVLDTVANGGTGFNQSGTNPGYVFDSNSQSALAIAVQPSDGKIIASGHTSTHGYVARYLSYNNSSLSFSSLGTAKIVYAYRTGSAYEGMLLVGFDSGTSCLIARVDASDMILDATFGLNGLLVLYGVTGLSHISLDENGEIIIAGTQSSQGWAQLITASGVVDTVFTVPSSIVAINHVYVQNSNRYIAAGKDNISGGNGVLTAFIKNSSGIVVDTTFNPLGVTPGSYKLGTTGLYDLVIDGDDTIVVAYSATTVKVAKVDKHGLRLIPAFNSGSVIDTGITPKNAAEIFCDIDSSNNIIIATSTSSNTLKVVRYDASGGTSTPFTGSGVSGGIQTISDVGTSGVTLTDMLETTTGKTILTGYNSGGASGYLFASRLDSTGALDAGWNSGGSLTTTVNSATSLSYASIAINGEIYVAGGTGTTPVLARIYGDSYVTENEQQPFTSPDGTLDSAFGTSGALNLNTASALTLGAIKKIYMYSDGSMLLATNTGTTTKITKLTSSFAVDTTFNSGGSIGTGGVAGSITIASATNIRDLYVANGTSDTGSIFVTGDISGAVWAAKISATGSSLTTLSASTALTLGSAIRKTTNGRILVAGYNGSSGVISAYQPSGSSLDLSFGNGGGTGYYTTGVNVGIYDMVVDSYNRIYIAYKSGSTIVVQRLYSDGTAVDTAFSATAIAQTNSLSSTQIKLALDESNNQLVVAVQDGSSTNNILKVARFSTVDGSGAGSSSAITVTNKNLNLSDLFIDSTQNIYVIGYNATDNKAILSRMFSSSSTTIYIDDVFGSGGIINSVVGSMTIVSAGTLSAHDYDTYIVGYDGSNIPYLARFPDSVIATQVSKSIPVATVGTIDLSLDRDAGTPDGGVALSGLSGYTAQAVYTMQSGTNCGKTLIAFSNGTSTRIGQYNADMNLDTTSFNGAGTNPGLTEVLTLATVNSLTVDLNGKIIIAGTTTGGAQKVVRYTSSGTLDVTFSTLLTNLLGTTVGQQKSGRYIVGGEIGSQAVINAYISTGTADDITFGPAGANGYYTTYYATSQIDDFVIDGNDFIYAVYRNSSNHIIIEKVTANGSGYLYSVDTGIVATQQAHIALDNNGTHVLVGASTSSGVYTRLYSCSTITAVATAQQMTSTSSDVLSKITGSNTDFIGAIYTTTPMMEICRVLGATGLLDTSFGTSGIASAEAESATSMRGIAILPDGRIMMAGYNGSNPVAMRFYGYPYTGLQDAQTPNEASAGTLDTTIASATSGALELDTLTGLTTLAGSTAKRIYTYNDGRMLLVFDGANSGADTVMVRLLKDFTLDTTGNNGTGFGSNSGYVTISGKTSVTSLYVNQNNQIFVAGGATTSWIRAYNDDGSVLINTNTISWTNPTSNLANGVFAVEQQSSSRLIVAGLGSTNGTIYAYTTLGALDTTFATGTGIYSTGVAVAIADIAIDNLDRILLAYVSGASTVVARLSSDGSSLSSIAGTAISSVTGNEVRVITDASANIVVAAATSTGFCLCRYNPDGVSGNSPSSAVTITAGGSSTSHLGNIYATADGKVVLVGYETTGNNVIVARLSSSFILDTTFNASGSVPGVLTTTIGSLNRVYDATIHADDRIMIIGGNNASADPYIGRVFGDAYTTYQSQSPGLAIPGMLDHTWATSGIFTISSLGSGALNSSVGQAIIALANGNNYIAVNNGTNSLLVRTIANGSLDTTFNSSGTNYVAGIAQSNAPSGVYSMMLDGSSRLVLVGTTVSGHGWIQRYTAGNAGTIDSTFNSGSYIDFGASTVATTAVQQTLGRLIIAGKSTNGALFAYTNTGVLDTTFGTSGVFSLTANTNPIYALVCDQYDRLIIAYLNAGGTAVNLSRLTPTGELDTTFGSSGVVTGVISAADTASSVCVGIDIAGNIVVAATNSTNTISVHAFDNGTIASAGANGSSVHTQVNVTTLTNTPRITDLLTTSDGNIIIIGNQTSTNPMWAIRFTSGYVVDTAVFGTSGIFTYSAGGGNTPQAHVYANVTVDSYGRLLIVGTENISGTNTPTLIRVYDTPNITENAQSPNSKPIGTNDPTFGVGTNTNGINFFALASSLASYGQVAQAVAFQDNNNFVIALDGQSSTSGGASEIFINKFDTDGLLNTNFNSTGQAVVSLPYSNQYVRDMMTFTTSGVHKAILVGYATSSTLGSTNSLIMQYNLDAATLDSSFGGFTQNPAGVAFGDAQQINGVSQQSTGRIIAAGKGLNGNDIILGYTTAGILDTTFGLGGCVTQGVNPLYAHAVDSFNRIVIAYTNGSNQVIVARFLADGSALDTAFAPATYISSCVSNSNLKIAIDSSNNVTVAAVTSSGGRIDVVGYSGTDGSVLKAKSSFGFFSTRTNTVTGTVTDSSSTINNPKWMAITPDNTTGYIANYNGNTVSIVNLTTGAVTGIVTDSGSTINSPQSIAITPDGTKAYVANYGNNSVSIINVSTGAVTGTVTDSSHTFLNPIAIAITPDGTKAYVINYYNTSTISIINVSTGAVTGTVTDSSHTLLFTTAIAITPDGTKAYIVNAGSHYMSIMNTSTNTITGSVSDSGFLAYYPQAIAITPDGTTAYVANRVTNTVSVVNLSTNTVTGIVTDLSSTTFGNPVSIAITPDGATAYVANDDSKCVSVINLSTNAVTGVVTDLSSPTFNALEFVTIQPDSTKAYTLNYNSNTVSIIDTESIASSNIGGTSGSNYTLGRLLIDQLGRAVVVAYDTALINIVVFRLVVSTGLYILDTAFNSTGYFTCQAGGGTVSQVAKNAMIHPDGRIIIVGSEN